MLIIPAGGKYYTVDYVKNKTPNKYGYYESTPTFAETNLDNYKASLGDRPPGYDYNKTLQQQLANQASEGYPSSGNVADVMAWAKKGGYNTDVIPQDTTMQQYLKEYGQTWNPQTGFSAGSKNGVTIPSTQQTLQGQAIGTINSAGQPTGTKFLDAQNVITPESLQTTQPFPLVSANTTPPYNVSGLQAPVMPEYEATPQEQKASGITSQLGNLYNQLVGKSADQTKADTTYGVDAAQKNIQDLAAQLTILKNEAAAIPLQLQQGAAEKGLTIPALAAQQNSRLRTNAIAALGISSLLAASQGQLSTAQALADKAVEQKYAPIEEQIAALTANLELILNDPLTSLQDKQRALEQNAIQQQQAEAVSQAKSNAADVWDIATTAAQNGNNFVAGGQYTSLSTALDAISKAPTKEQALQIASSVGLIAPPIEVPGSPGASGVDTQIIQLANGKDVLVDKNTGEVIKEIGAEPQVYRDQNNNFFVDGKPITLEQFTALGINEKFVQSGQTVSLSQAKSGQVPAIVAPTSNKNIVPNIAPGVKITDLLSKSQIAGLATAGIPEGLYTAITTDILAGTSLEAIRQDLIANGQSPTILDKFDQIVGIEGLLSKQKNKSSSGREV